MRPCTRCPPLRPSGHPRLLLKNPYPACNRGFCAFRFISVHYIWRIDTWPGRPAQRTHTTLFARARGHDDDGQPLLHREDLLQRKKTNGSERVPPWFMPAFSFFPPTNSMQRPAVRARALARGETPGPECKNTLRETRSGAKKQHTTPGRGPFRSRHTRIRHRRPAIRAPSSRARMPRLPTRSRRLTCPAGTGCRRQHWPPSGSCRSP